MRLLLVLLVVTSCGKESSDGVPDSPPPKAAEPPAAPVAKQSEARPSDKTVEMNCDAWGIENHIKSLCGAEVTLSMPEIIPDDENACRRSGKAASGARIEVMIGNVRRTGHTGNSRQFPPEPATSEDSGKRTTKIGAFPYGVTIRQRLRGGETVCDNEKVAELARAIARALPQEEGTAYKEANLACDGLLSSADLEQACGTPGALRATEMEDGESVYCNRVGPGGLIFIVSQHTTEAQAKSAESVAKGSEHTVVGVHGKFLVELKTSPARPSCSDAALSGLMKGVLERLSSPASAP